MYFTLLLKLLFFAFCLGDENIHGDTHPNINTPTGLELLSSGPCGLLDVPIPASPQCQYDFNLYTKAICSPSIKPDPDTNQTFLDNFWAYKSKVLK